MNFKRWTALFLVVAMTVALLCIGVYADPADETPATTPEENVTDTAPDATETSAEPEQPAAAPVTADPQNDGKQVLTIIGDSIAAGYGLSEDVNSLQNQLTLHGNNIVDGSYPQILRDEAGFDVVYKDARESYTCFNFLRMLDSDYDREMANPSNYYYRFLSECTFFLPKLFGGIDDTEYLKNNIKDHVATSDAIIINLGNNDTFTTALLDMVFRTMYYAYGGAIQPAMTALKGQFTPATTLEDIIGMTGGTYADLFTKLDEYTELFKQNMDRMLGVIRQLNPTAKIYYYGMYNTFEYAGPEDLDLRNMLYQSGIELSNKLKDYATKESAYKDDIIFVDVTGTETWASEPMTSPLYWLQFLVHCHPDYVGHRFMADQMMEAMGKKSPGENSGHANCPMAKYVDLVQSMWYHEPIDYVLSHGIMNGMTDNTFGPDVVLTRAMVVTMLYAMDGKPAVSGNNPFSDIQSGDWYINPVLWAAEKGVVAGYDDGTFRPGNPVTREELATMLRSYAAYKGKDASANGDLSGFADWASISGWATDNVSWAVGHGIISGRDGNMIAPKGTATRAEAATMFARVSQNVL